MSQMSHTVNQPLGILGNTLLHVAAESNALAVTESLLMKMGADVNAVNSMNITPLHMAGSAEIAQVLIRKGAKVNAADEDGDTPLHDAKSTEIAQVLIDNGADLNAVNHWDRTPLHSARSGLIAWRLIRDGAEVNVVDEDGDTPLHDAKSRDVTWILIQKGADVNAVNRWDRTPLHYAKSAEIARILIRKGAKINVVDQYGNTPLHNAKSMEIAQVLIDNGADLNAINENGFSPLYTALRLHQDVPFLPRVGIKMEDALHVARVLIDNGAALNARNTDNMPLHRTLPALFSSVRVSNVLAWNGIRTLRALATRTEDELLMFDRLGPAILTEIKEKLAEVGLTLGRTLDAREVAADGADVNAVRNTDNMPVYRTLPALFSVRVSNILAWNNISTLRALVRRTAEELLMFDHLGPAALTEIKEKLAEVGLTLGRTLNANEQGSS